jgi:uncharacterized membrane protein YozB (DUF420 family)
MDGFLGTRGSFMLDCVVTAMVAVVPLLLASVYLVRNRRRYVIHKRIQLTLGLLLLVIIALFEIEMRVSGWRGRAAGSPYWTEGAWNDSVDYSLAVHLCFAVPTFVIWCVVIGRALAKFPRPPAPSPHSASHRVWGRLAVAGMVLTALTGWVFYYLAFAG